MMKNQMAKNMEVKWKLGFHRAYNAIVKSMSGTLRSLWGSRCRMS